MNVSADVSHIFQWILQHQFIVIVKASNNYLYFGASHFPNAMKGGFLCKKKTSDVRFYRFCSWFP